MSFEKEMQSILEGQEAALAGLQLPGSMLC